MSGLASYRCHKVVNAGKISGISSAVGTDSYLHFYNGHKELVVDSWVLKHRPGEDDFSLVGGYFVVYEDGYKSWSPAKAFEEGYTLIEVEK